MTLYLAAKKKVPVVGLEAQRCLPLHCGFISWIFEGARKRSIAEERGGSVVGRVTPSQVLQNDSPSSDPSIVAGVGPLRGELQEKKRCTSSVASDACYGRGVHHLFPVVPRFWSLRLSQKTILEKGKTGVVADKKCHGLIGGQRKYEPS